MGIRLPNASHLIVTSATLLPLQSLNTTEPRSDATNLLFSSSKLLNSSNHFHSRLHSQSTSACMSLNISSLRCICVTVVFLCQSVLWLINCRVKIIRMSDGGTKTRREEKKAIPIPCSVRPAPFVIRVRLAAPLQPGPPGYI